MSFDKIPSLLLGTFCLCLHSLVLARRTRPRYCQVGSSSSWMSYSALECPHMQGGVGQRKRKREREREKEFQEGKGHGVRDTMGKGTEEVRNAEKEIDGQSRKK